MTYYFGFFLESSDGQTWSCECHVTAMCFHNHYTGQQTRNISCHESKPNVKGLTTVEFLLVDNNGTYTLVQYNELSL